MLVHHPDYMYDMSHLILDEIHERGIDCDLLYVVIKRLRYASMKNGQHVPKLVLMSATFNTEQVT